MGMRKHKIAASSFRALPTWVHSSSLWLPCVVTGAGDVRVERLKAMSTRSTLAHGPNFHLYHDLIDRDHVYLEIEGAKVEIDYGRTTVPIPMHIWEVIRRYQGIDLQLADKTDDELRQYVEQELDARLAWYGQIEERAKRMAALAGSLSWGAADQQRGVQLTRGMEYFTHLREHQRQVQQAIAELEQANPGK